MEPTDILIIATVLLAIITLLPLWRHEAWWVRGLDFPRLQFLIFAVGLLLANVYFLGTSDIPGQLTIAANLACLIYQAWWIAPYTRLAPCEVVKASTADTNDQLSIITANVLTPNRQAPALLDLVKKYQPDVLVTLESDRWWQTQLQPLETDYPHLVQCPQDNLYGMHVYSRLPMLEHSIKYLIEDDVPSFHLQLQLRNDNIVQIHLLHPAPPSPTENAQSTERDAELIMVAKTIAKTSQPTIVAGDLNDVAWSATTRLFRKLSGLLDPRVGRGIFNSFHAGYWFVRWPLDHLFHSHHFKLAEMKRLPAFGSDHFAILTRLIYEPDNSNPTSAFDAKASDHAWADDKLEQVE